MKDIRTSSVVDITEKDQVGVVIKIKGLVDMSSHHHEVYFLSYLEILYLNSKWYRPQRRK